MSTLSYFWNIVNSHYRVLALRRCMASNSVNYRSLLHNCIFILTTKVEKINISAFYLLQKHENILNMVSTHYESRKIFCFYFPPCTKAEKYFICGFHPLQKWKNIMFSLSTLYKSRKNIFLRFLPTTKAGKIFIFTFYSLQLAENI